MCVTLTGWFVRLGGPNGKVKDVGDVLSKGMHAFLGSSGDDVPWRLSSAPQPVAPCPNANLLIWHRPSSTRTVTRPTHSSHLAACA
jgi:hypothetical protein